MHRLLFAISSAYLSRNACLVYWELFAVYSKFAVKNLLCNSWRIFCCNLAAIWWQSKYIYIYRPKDLKCISGHLPVEGNVQSDRIIWWSICGQCSPNTVYRSTLTRARLLRVAMPPPPPPVRSSVDLHIANIESLHVVSALALLLSCAQTGRLHGRLNDPPVCVDNECNSLPRIIYSRIK